MQRNKLQLSLIFTLSMMVLFTTWFTVTADKVTLHKNNPNDPNSFTTMVDAIQFNKLGQPYHIFKSPKLTNYLQNDTTDISQPFYIFKKDNEPPWHVRADRGKAYQGTDRIVLTGHINIQQLPGLNSRNIILLTDKMIFYPNRSFAETDRPVTIKQPGIIVHGIGLQADLKKGYIKLLSKTRGEYKNLKN